MNANELNSRAHAQWVRVHKDRTQKCAASEAKVFSTDSVRPSRCGDTQRMAHTSEVLNSGPPEENS